MLKNNYHVDKRQLSSDKTYDMPENSIVDFFYD